jgi:hypothetical protein
MDVSYRMGRFEEYLQILLRHFEEQYSKTDPRSMWALNSIVELQRKFKGPLHVGLLQLARDLEERAKSNYNRACTEHDDIVAEKYVSS